MKCSPKSRCWSRKDVQAAAAGLRAKPRQSGEGRPARGSAHHHCLSCLVRRKRRRRSQERQAGVLSAKSHFFRTEFNSQVKEKALGWPRQVHSGMKAAVLISRFEGSIACPFQGCWAGIQDFSANLAEPWTRLPWRPVPRVYRAGKEAVTAIYISIS